MRGLFLVIGCMIVSMAMAQRKEVKGVLKDSVTHMPVGFANITNLSTGKTAITNTGGLFTLEAGIRDLISFSYIGYHFDTIVFSDEYAAMPLLELTLKPLSNTLQGVTVRTKGYSQYQLDSMERRKEFLANTGALKKAVGGANSGAGIALNLDRFSRREKTKRNAYDFFDNNEKEEYINYRFTNTIVAEYTGLKDDSLQLFMQQFRPSYFWLREHLTDDDIKFYINDNLKNFYKRED